MMRPQRTLSTSSMKLEVEKMKSQRDDNTYETKQDMQTNLVNQSKQAPGGMNQNFSNSQQTAQKGDSSFN